MHGMIMDLVSRFVIDTYDEETWKELRIQAGVGGKTYHAIMDYSDDETFALVATASKMTGLTIGDVLEAFGEYIAPELINMSAVLIKRDWRTLDFLANTENIIHVLVREAWKVSPPVLRFERTAMNQVTLRYDSKRKMCAVARGIARGVAAHYNESMTIIEEKCMQKGADECVLHFQVIGGGYQQYSSADEAKPRSAFATGD